MQKLFEMLEGVYLNQIDNLFTLISLVIGVIVLTIVLIWFLKSKKTINNISKNKIDEFINTKKYIPNLFVEMNESKENLRYFFYGTKWKKRIINEFNDTFNDNPGKILSEVFEGRDVSFKLGRRISKSNLLDEIEKTREFLNKLHKREIEYPEKYKETMDLFEVFSNTYEDCLLELSKKARLIQTKYVVLTGRAGNGKTNLLCSFAQLAMATGHRCIFIEGKK